MNMEFVSLSL